MKGFTLFTYLRDCSVKTEPICRNNCAKTVSIVYKSTALCIDNCPCPLLLSRPLDIGPAERKIGQSLSANSNNILSAILSHTPCGLSSLVQCHFFSESGPMNDLCPFPNLFHTEKRVWHSPSILFHCLFDPGNVVEHRHKI